MVQVYRGLYEYLFLPETIGENTCPYFMRGEQLNAREETCPKLSSNGVWQGQNQNSLQVLGYTGRFLPHPPRESPFQPPACSPAPLFVHCPCKTQANLLKMQGKPHTPCCKPSQCPTAHRIRPTRSAWTPGPMRTHSADFSTMASIHCSLVHPTTATLASLVPL